MAFVHPLPSSIQNPSFLFSTIQPAADRRLFSTHSLSHSFHTCSKAIALPKSSSSAPSSTLHSPESSALTRNHHSHPSPVNPIRKEKILTSVDIYAVVMVGGNQHILFPGRAYRIRRLPKTNVNDKITLNRVLLVGTRSTIWVGKPLVTNAVVHAVIEEQGYDPYILVFKFKRKKRYSRQKGHRQQNTTIRVTSISGYHEYPSLQRLPNPTN